MKGFIYAASVVAIGMMSINAVAERADFDSLQEGDLGTTFIHNNIEFFEPDAYGLNGLFVVEWATDTLSGPFFSPPNTLAMSGFTPGPTAVYSRAGSFKMRTGGINNFAELQLFVFENSTNTITLEALLGGEVVASDTIQMNDSFLPGHYTLTVSGALFDTLRIFGAGQANNGAWFGMVDNVEIASVICTGNEKLVLTCNDTTLKAVVKKGEPNAFVTLRLDNDPDTDVEVQINENGRARVRFRNVDIGQHTVSIVGCGVSAERECP